MPIRPKFLHVLGLGLRTAGVEWRLRRRGNGRAEQDSAFAALLPRLAAASHWRGLGLEPRMGYAAFQSRIPLQTHAEIAPAVARMAAGEYFTLIERRYRAIEAIGAREEEGCVKPGLYGRLVATNAAHALTREKQASEILVQLADEASALLSKQER